MLFFDHATAITIPMLTKQCNVCEFVCVSVCESACVCVSVSKCMCVSECVFVCECGVCECV